MSVNTLDTDLNHFHVEMTAIYEAGIRIAKLSYADVTTVWSHPHHEQLLEGQRVKL